MLASFPSTISEDSGDNSDDNEGVEESNPGGGESSDVDEHIDRVRSSSANVSSSSGADLLMTRPYAESDAPLRSSRRLQLHHSSSMSSLGIHRTNSSNVMKFRRRKSITTRVLHKASKVAGLRQHKVRVALNFV